MCVVGTAPRAGTATPGVENPTPSAASDAASPTAQPAKKKRKSYTRWTLPAGGASRSGDPEIIFTFDDGPHEKYTGIILDQLAKYHIKAVFFWVGRRIRPRARKLAERKAMILRAVKEGHVIANHTLSHPFLCRLATTKVAREIDENRARFAAASGQPVRLFRTPFGDYCRRLVRMLGDRGLHHIHWDIDPMEWQDHDGMRVWGTLRRHIRRVKPGQRAIILMHDIHKATTIALPRVLEWIAEENKRRARRGKPQIRIVDGTVLAMEDMAPALATWIDTTMGAVTRDLGGSLARLIP